MERILGVLTNKGFGVTDIPSNSDLIILNTCAVKLTTENRMVSRFRELSTYNLPIIITGCLPRMNTSRCDKECAGFAAMIDPNSIDRLSEIVDRVMNGERGITLFSDPHWEIFNTPYTSTHPIIHILPISYGCLGNCAFCGVKNVRGRLVSVPIRNIRMDFEKALRSGKKEFWITSQDDAIYGWDMGATLNDLLSSLLEVGGDYRLRIGMMNPGGAMKLVPEIFNYFNDDRLYKFVHIPVQSGSDRVLTLMKRQHGVEEFRTLVDEFRKNVPDITISTDIIVGFPGETDEDFQMTVDLIEEAKPDIVNISKFYPRPNTDAARMKKVPTDVITKRTKELSAIVEKMSKKSNELSVGKVRRVLISDEKNGRFVGRTHNYKPVFLDNVELGKFYNVKITSSTSKSLFGEVVND